MTRPQQKCQRTKNEKAKKEQVRLVKAKCCLFRNPQNHSKGYLVGGVTLEGNVCCMGAMTTLALEPKSSTTLSIRLFECSAAFAVVKS